MKKKYILKILVLLFFIVNILINLNYFYCVSADEIFVDQNHLSYFHSIQDAIDNANENDTIYVASGTYTEQLTIDKSIILHGEHKSNTTIDGMGNTCIVISSNLVEIQGFTLVNGSYGIYIDNTSEHQIHDNTFKQTTYGLFISENSINSNIYSNNFIDNNEHAIDLALNNWHYLSSGNYWDDYTGNDTNNDNIGNSPYLINGSGNLDLYPYMTPFTLPPNVDFWYSPSNPTTQTPIIFNDVSMDPDGVIMKWLWDFGDGTENISQNPTHIYEDDGVYLVSLTVFDDLGSSNSELYEISVDNVPPTAYFIHSPAKPLDIQEVDFRDSSTDPDGTIVAWTWTIDDSIRSNSSMFRYTFPDDGVYIIQLKVEDDDEYTSTYSSEITVQNVGPTAGFSFFTEQGNLTKNNPISFNDNSNDLDGSIVRWHWDFGDGQTSTDKNTKKTYSTDGVYLVTLSVEDDDGETESISKHVTIESISTNEGFLAGLSIFDIFFVGAIIIAVIFVFFLSKKYAF